MLLNRMLMYIIVLCFDVFRQMVKGQAPNRLSMYVCFKITYGKPCELC